MSYHSGTGACTRCGPPNLAPFSIDGVVQPTISGWVFVTPQRYVAVTDVAGKFCFPSLVAGEYRLRVWHERTGWVDGLEHPPLVANYQRYHLSNQPSENALGPRKIPADRF